MASQDGVDFMVMEYVAGKTLDKSIPPDGLPTDVALLYDTSHSLPRSEFIKETLNWLDQYLGPVQ